MEFEAALEVFVRAMALMRSFTHPCLAERVEGVWTFRDAPRRRGDYRKEEWVAWREAPADVDRIARAHTRGRFFVCALRTLDEEEGPLLSAYKALGYSLMARERFFVRELAGLKRTDFGPFPDAYRVERVRTLEMADRLAKAARSRQVLLEHLADSNPAVRPYVALSGAGVAGWVRSVSVGDSAWVSNLFVAAAHRRRGLGSALMASMLLDDAALGVKTSVLLASPAGAQLYPLLGYEKIGELMILVPRWA